MKAKTKKPKASAAELLDVDKGLWISDAKYPGKSKVPAAVEGSDLSKFKVPMRPTAPIVAGDGEYQVDLAFMTKYKSKNEGYGVILQLIHLRSRYLYSKLLKKKSEAADSLIELIEELPIQMNTLRTDAGTEFINNKLQKYLNDKGIRLVVVNKNRKGIADNLSSYSMGVVERANLTVEYLIERYMEVKDTLKYNDVFDRLIANYNNSPHLALKGHSPAEVLNNMIKPDRNDVAYKMLKHDLDVIDRNEELRQKIAARLPIGSYVRVLKKIGRFTKGAAARGSDEVYKIVDNSSWRVVIEDSDGNKQARLYHELIPASEDGAKKSAIAAERNKLKQQQKFVKLQRESGLDVDDRGAVIIPESLATTRSKRERKAPGYLKAFQT